MESEEAQEPDVVKAGKKVPMCAWHQHPGREGVLVDGVPPQQEEAEHVWGERAHATVPPGVVNSWIFFKLTLVSVSCSTIKTKKRL